MERKAWFHYTERLVSKIVQLMLNVFKTTIDVVSLLVILVLVVMVLPLLLLGMLYISLIITTLSIGSKVKIVLIEYRKSIKSLISTL